MAKLGYNSMVRGRLPDQVRPAPRGTPRIPVRRERPAPPPKVVGKK